MVKEVNSRVEAFLKCIATKDLNNLLEPQSRIEQFLKAIATGDISNLPKPQSRSEQYLDYIARSSGGGNEGDYIFHNIALNEQIINDLNLIGTIEDKVTIEVVDAV